MKERLQSIDFLRGLVMVIMALDHVRDFYSHPGLHPTSMADSNPELFFTRWITHFCAPVFVFLAGTGAYLQTMRGTKPAELSRFLVSRGFWLIILELTVVRSSWSFQPFAALFVGQVIWALGWSMIALAALIHLRIKWIVAIGLAMIVSHNAFDNVAVDWSNPVGFLWAILHTGDALTPIAGIHFLPLYPLIPWIGVMAVGYAFGTMYTMDQARRTTLFKQLGVGLVLAFLVIRGYNHYGDHSHWELQRDWAMNICSFLNCTKYPPSLDYLLMTLGPAIILLGYAERWSNALTRAFSVFGKVPMFYYLIHIPVIHASAILVEYLRGTNVGAMSATPFNTPLRMDLGFDLPWVYVAWIIIVAALYPLCKAYARVKKQSSNPLLRYL